MIKAAPRLPRAAALAAVCAGVFLASLDQTSVVTALPAMMADVGVTIDRLNDMAWVVTAYLLGFTAAMPLLGRAGDVYGYRRLYLGALALFGAGSAGVALADGLGWLVAARAAQAVGGGALIPAALALASEGLPPGRRAVVFGVVGAAAEAGGVMGPLYGGALTEWLGWRWIFWSNLPIIGLLALALAGTREAGRSGGRLDVAGGALLAAGLSLLTAGLAQRSLFGGGSALPYALIGGGCASLAAMVVVERKAASPIVSAALFRARGFAAALGAQLPAGAALMLALAAVPLMTNTVLGESALEGGLRLMRLTGAIPAGALLGGWAAARVGARPPALAGLALAAACFLLLATWDETVAEPRLTLHLVLGGFGFGLLIAPLTAAAVDAADETHRATAAAVDAADDAHRATVAADAADETHRAAAADDTHRATAAVDAADDTHRAAAAADAADETHRATAAAWVTAARTLGMTLGLAAMAAAGVDYFQSLAAGLPAPIQLPGESSAAFAERAAAYEAGLSNASFAVFRLFFWTGAALSALAMIPALWLRSSRR